MKNENISAEELYLSKDETSSTDGTATTAEPRAASYETSAPAINGCCPNVSMVTATEIQIGSTVEGCICCPEAVQWYKIQPDPDDIEDYPLYTIHSIGPMDVRGYLFRSTGVQIASNDEHTEGSGFFKMARRLTKGETYYLMVTGNGTNTGCFSEAAMDECMNVIVPIYNGEETDITGGALYFHSFPNPEDWTYHNNYTLITVDGTEGFWFYK